MKVTLENNVLTIVIPCDKPVPSKSGKSLILASTRGNQKTDLTIDGKVLIVSLNAYVSAG